MGLYVEVRKSENGLPITNATFSYYSYINYGNGVYFVFAPTNVSFWVNAPGRYSAIIPSDYYYKYFVWLAIKPPPHSKSHSSGWT